MDISFEFRSGNRKKSYSPEDRETLTEYTKKAIFREKFLRNRNIESMILSDFFRTIGKLCKGEQESMEQTLQYIHKF